MGITSLDAALAGLRVAQQQINVISANVANVGTPGYSRKILPQSAQVIAGMTVGVKADTIIRRVDLNLERDLWTQVSAVGYLDVQQIYLERVEQFHGPPDKELSIAAELGRLKDAFSALSDKPEDGLLQAQAVNQAIDTANKINDFSTLLNTLRNDAQEEMQTSINRINDLLVQIANTNDEIQDNLTISRSTAVLEDKRDEAIKELSGLMEISFFQRGDGVMVVQTNRGVEIASNEATLLSFDSTPLAATNYYPASANGVIIGDPTKPSAVDIAALSPGGKLGGLIDLRDSILPKQLAQLDELAHKLALRMEAQGLRLFTNASGTIPADTAPTPNPPGPLTPVEYVGFASEIQVNTDIINDNSLIKNGTYGSTLNTGSNEVIRRIIQFGFGNTEYQIAQNTNTATQVDLLNRGADDLQTWLGVFSSNTLIGGRDLSAYATVGDLVTFANGALDDPNDQFQITFEEARTGAGPTTITIDLSVADGFPGANAAAQLVAHINNEIAGAPVPASLAAVASIGSNGQIVIQTRGTIEIDSTFGATGMTQTGLDFLGLADNAGSPIATTDPYFDVQVGNNAPVRITLEPGDTHTDLITKLQAVPGLAVDTVNFALDGLLRLRPGNDFDNPDFGGDIKIIGGPFTTSSASYGAPPATTTRTSIDNGVNIASALFGTYTITGGSVINSSAVSNVLYGSETNGSLPAPIPTVQFRSDYLGPNANISTRLLGSTTLIDYGQKMVNEQTQALILIQASQEDEEALRQALEGQFLDESGVNLDEELGNLIMVQTAYSAAARVITAIDELFQELLNAVR